MNIPATSIHITWDKSSRLKYEITGASLPKPRDDHLLWILAPSAPLFVAHQFGSMKPTHGLTLCLKISEIIVSDKYLLEPINSALRGGEIEFRYPGDNSVEFRFFPKHDLVHNSDSLEEGVRQLVYNYFYAVYSSLAQYNQIAISTSTIMCIGSYFKFLDDQINKNKIGPYHDQWNPDFPVFSAELRRFISMEYYVPYEGQDEWAKNQSIFLVERWKEINSKLMALSKAMGLTGSAIKSHDRNTNGSKQGVPTQIRRSGSGDRTLWLWALLIGSLASIGGTIGGLSQGSIQGIPDLIFHLVVNTIFWTIVTGLVMLIVKRIIKK